MAAKLTSDEEQATKHFLEEINRRRHDQIQEPVAWNTAVKFLMARKFDVKRAIDLFIAHEEVRKREGLLHVDPLDGLVRRELLTEKFTILPSRDSNGAALALFTARRHFPPSTNHQGVLKGLVFQLDAALESPDTQRNGLVFIYDMTGSKYQNFDYELSIKILNMLKGGYPARLKKVLIVTAPLWFKAPFKILRLFVREKLRDRVFTVSVSQLSLHIPMSGLPRAFGGNLEINHHDWLRKCLHTYMDNEITAFFDTMDNRNSPYPNMSVSSLPSTVTTPTSPEGNNSIFSFSSDMESEESKETIPEKHSDEDREKEVAVEKGKTSSMKRSSDSTASQGGDQPPPTLPRKKRPNSGDHTQTIANLEESIHTPDSDGMTIKELVEYTKIKGRKGLVKEYYNIKEQPPVGTFNISKAKYNLPKNRYTDVLCLDQTRVHLSMIDGDPSSDYINANMVDGYKQKHAYISSQGPLPRTFPDFWRMIWEQMVLLVVMTTRTHERSRLKCGQYWPLQEDTEEEFGQFLVKNNGVDKRDNYRVTTLIVTNTKTNESRELTHFQFTSWPDFGVPHSAQAFLEFMFHVREHQAERVKQMGDQWQGHPLGPPMVVHCSAGIGRTGTFITMDICTKRLADRGTVDIQKTVKRIRTQRAFSIQMPDQYVFCHLALIEHAQREGLLGEIDLAGFDDSSSDSD